MKPSRVVDGKLNNVRLSLRHNTYVDGEADTEQFFASSFRNTRFFIDMVKNCEKMIFREREEEMDQHMRLMDQQNQFMESLSLNIAAKSCREISSIKVLQELDLNKRQAYESLEWHNMNLKQRIEELELTLESLEKLERSATLCPEYLAKLENKIKRRRKCQEVISQQLEAETQTVEEFKQTIQNKYGNGKQCALQEALQYLMD